MKDKKVNQTDSTADLRRLAEERLGVRGISIPPAGTEEESQRLIHELQVHQIELEMQNEDLRKARDERETVLEKYTDLYDFAPVSYFTLDRAGTIRSVNFTGAGLIGINRSQLNGQCFRLFVPARARPAFADFLEKVFASPIREACELELLAEGNSPRFVKIDAVADASGEECRIALIDFTERKQKEEELLKSEERYRSLVEATSQIVWTTNAAGEAIDDLTSMQAFSGRSREEVMGLGWSNAIHPDDIERAVAIWRHSVETGYTFNAEFRMLRHDGKYRCLSARGIPVKGNEGNIREWVGTCTDITELNDSAKKLSDSETRYRRLFESAKEGILILDAETGKVLDVNPFLLQLLGYSFAALYGQYIWGLGVFKAIAASREAFKTLQNNEYIRYEDLPLETIDGRSIAVEFISNVYQVEHSKVIQCIIRDITEHRKLEEQLRQAQKMESIGTFAGGIAHDFNNILTAIVGYGYVAHMNMGPDDPHRENIEHMLEGADRATQLTKDLLIFSRKQVSERRPVDLNEIVRKVEKFLTRVIGEDISCIITLHADPLVINADAHQLEQVLMNLATNARDALAGGGELMIGTEQIILGDDFVARHGYGKPGGYALMTVSDTGEGMDDETRRKIFDPFFTTKEVGKGTGLGLAVVYGIMKQHEGFINVYSEPGAGTTFRIYLPLISAELGELEKEQEEEIHARGTETILLAEDDESVRGLISIVLKQQGYTVIEAVDGADAVKKFMENRETIQLFISDIIMPNMNGQEAYDAMAAFRPEMKVIFVSGYAPDFVRQKLSFENSVTLISKPISPHALIKNVRNVLDEKDEQVPVK